MKQSPTSLGPIHFVGIGGIGMSGIAEILHSQGYRVQGSDIAESPNVLRLRELGIAVEIGHDARHVGDVAVVVTSSAVKADNPEVEEARRRWIPVVRRAEMLGELMRLKKAIAAGGTHGKTTTTSMIGWLLECAELNPTVINGGIVNAYGTNTRLGDGDWMVVEADESDGSFLRLPATSVIVTNIDPEHLENYESFDEVRDAYETFVSNIPFYGFAALCIDHPEVQALVGRVTDRRIVTYGLGAQADVRGTNLRLCNGGYRFDVVLTDRVTRAARTIRGVYLPMWGEHNVTNALSCVVVAQELGIPDHALIEALGSFAGVKRRFTRTGEAGGITVIDDYGHHPVEIAAVLKASREAFQGRIVAVIQPHRYSRLAGLFEDFCSCFIDADVVVVSDVYPAGENPIEGADRDHLVEGLRKCGHRHVEALDDPSDLAALVARVTQPGDGVICLGAGTITRWANALPEELRAVLAEADMPEVG
ncbi:MAG: UDP-N-acetylmuramate--L-alanine ligase [Rhodospirillales bacterium]|nr:UDP-N-acetylmuramate--L-alanine ligase [Rhodospirillales bacterium]